MDLGKRVLVLGAHQDDLEMNAGGLIHRLAREGVDVFGLTLVRYEHTGKLWSVRLTESERAAHHLNLTGSWTGEGIDCRMHAQKRDLIGWVDAFIRKLRPTTMIGHFFADTHQDHVTAYEVMVAAGRRVPNMMMFKPVYPSGRPDIPFHPTMICKIEQDDLEAKMAAMREFKSQEERYGAHQWCESLRAVAAADAWTYGGFHGLAELFQVCRVAL